MLNIIPIKEYKQITSFGCATPLILISAEWGCSAVVENGKSWPGPVILGVFVMVFLDSYADVFFTMLTLPQPQGYLHKF